MSYSILILGASYGSLLGVKLTMAGHEVQLVCLPDEADVFNAEGARIRLPVRGRDAPIEINSKDQPGTLTAVTPVKARPGDFDLVALAMQEPQYGQREVRDLLDRIADAGLPCMSIMNMPPPPYLRRIDAPDVDTLGEAYADLRMWEGMDPALMTLASPDPQAFRPPGEKINLLQVGLPTNFRVARFASVEHTAILRGLENDIEAVRFDPGDEPIPVPVKLRVHESIFVPLAKWNMLLAGNYRCVGPDDMRSIREAVHIDLEETRAVYEWVGSVCRAIGAGAEDQVPFEKYAAAAENLGNPSSAARALAGGAKQIERVDKLVRLIGQQHGLQLDAVDKGVETVDNWLTKNQAA